MSKLKDIKKYLLSPNPADGPEVQADFAMHVEPVDVIAYVKSLRDSGFHCSDVGTASFESVNYPIVQLDITGDSPRKRLLIVAGVHGNEFAGALAVEDLVRQLKANPALYNNWYIQILAPVNPVGLAKCSRYDQDGYDINRDFKHFYTLGARLQRDAIKTFNPDVIVTLHESPQPDFFMFSEGKLSQELRGAITQKLKADNVKLASKSYLGIKTKAGIWEKPKTAFIIQRLLGMHTLGSYAYKLKIPMITTESNWNNSNVDERKRPHISVILGILSS